MIFVWILCFWGCAPPNAPETLDQLGSYLFTEFQNPDERYMHLGLQNLYTWVEENREDVQEGYRIENLTEEAILALGVTDKPDLEGLIGAAVATDIKFSVEELIAVSLGTDPLEIDPDAYGYFRREWDGDLDCFLRKECTEISFTAEIQNILPLGIVTDSKTKGTYKWFFLEEGDFIAQRRWLAEPAQSNQSWLEVNQDYAVNVCMPLESGMRFMDIEWVVTKLGDIPVPEDFALSLAISAMSKSRKNMEQYMEENL